MTASRALVVATLVALGAAPVLAQETPLLVVEDAVPAGGPDFFLVPFEVPDGTAEVEVRHASLQDGDILDFGVEDPAGSRGWGGGNDEPAIVGALAASRSYLPGPMPSGTWSVVVGKARLVSLTPRFRVEVFVRAAPTLPPATDRAPYQPTTLLTSSGPRFYAGDLHVHSEDSGDARPALGEIAAFARGRGLDFIVVTDHNTTSQVDKIGAAQASEGALLFVPGMEFTTYAGHMNAFGATVPVDHKLGLSTSLDDVVTGFAAQGALLSINHPNLNLGDVCIGCAWAHPVFEDVAAVEIATGGHDQAGFIFGQGARDFWDTLLDDGHHAAPVGGSDDHGAGVDLPAFGSPIGDPTTLIFADTLSVEALQQGLRDNRTVVKLQGPDDPMVDLQTTPPRAERAGRVDTVFGPADGAVRLTARVTGGDGHSLQWMRDGRPAGDPVAVDGDDVVLTLDVAVVDDERWRAEVLVEGIPRTVTGHVWLATETVDPGCACQNTQAQALPAAPVGLATTWWWRRRRRAAGDG